MPAYAATIHKSQGSEYPAVIIPVQTQHHAMLQRNLLYTGVTRGKRLVVLVGQRKAAAIAARNVSGRRRWSKLSEWLSQNRLSHDSSALPAFTGGLFRGTAPCGAESCPGLVTGTDEDTLDRSPPPGRRYSIAAAAAGRATTGKRAPSSEWEASVSARLIRNIDFTDHRKASKRK